MFTFCSHWCVYVCLMCITCLLKCLTKIEYNCDAKLLIRLLFYFQCNIKGTAKYNFNFQMNTFPKKVNF